MYIIHPIHFIYCYLSVYDFRAKHLVLDKQFGAKATTYNVLEVLDNPDQQLKKELFMPGIRIFV